MHPDCPDFDLCASCEAHPIPVHPSTHPMLKMKTSDAVVPTVYRVGQTNLIPTRQEETSKLSPALSVDTEKQEAMVSATQERAVETEMPSLASSAAGFTLPPLGLDARSDLFREFWPKVNEEYKVQMTNPDANQATQAANAQSTPADSANISMTMMDPFRDPEPKSTPEISAEVSLASAQPVAETPQMSQQTTTPVSTLNRSLAVLLDGYKSPTTSVTSHLSTSVNSVTDLATETSSTKPDDASRPLEATFVTDITVPDGQIFPPGAEFVKSWRMMNTGNVDWPESTELHYVSGEKFALELHGGSSAVQVGAVTAGSEIEIWTPELKVKHNNRCFKSFY